MNRCPITYEVCEGKYSRNGLKLLSKTITHLNDFPFTAKEQIQIATELTSKLSIQGVQPKLSVSFNSKKGEFEIVERDGQYILKPPHHLFEEVPQNEDLSLRLADLIGIEVPFHGLIYNVDGTLSYFIKRFDRIGKKKIAVEDFTQLLGYSRETKYEASMEKVASVLEKYCTFPILEKLKLFKLVLFNFLIGNEDMHLKNFSLITLNNKVTLSPGYDLVNTSILMKTKEEIALPIRGKKSNLNRNDFFNCFGVERLGLNPSILNKEFNKIQKTIPSWMMIIDSSFLSNSMKERYKKVIEERIKVFD